jgi:hypothetical protein
MDEKGKEKTKATTAKAMLRRNIHDKQRKSTRQERKYDSQVAHRKEVSYLPRTLC